MSRPKSPSNVWDPSVGDVCEVRFGGDWCRVEVASKLFFPPSVDFEAPASVTPGRSSAQKPKRYKIRIKEQNGDERSVWFDQCRPVFESPAQDKRIHETKIDDLGTRTDSDDDPPADRSISFDHIKYHPLFNPTQSVPEDSCSDPGSPPDREGRSPSPRQNTNKLRSPQSLKSRYHPLPPVEITSSMHMVTLSPDKEHRSRVRQMSFKNLLPQRKKKSKGKSASTPTSPQPRKSKKHKHKKGKRLKHDERLREPPQSPDKKHLQDFRHHSVPMGLSGPRHNSRTSVSWSQSRERTTRDRSLSTATVGPTIGLNQDNRRSSYSTSTSRGSSYSVASEGQEHSVQSQLLNSHIEHEEYHRRSPRHGSFDSVDEMRSRSNPSSPALISQPVCTCSGCEKCHAPDDDENGCFRQVSPSGNVSHNICPECASVSDEPRIAGDYNHYDSSNNDKTNSSQSEEDSDDAKSENASSSQPYISDSEEFSRTVQYARHSRSSSWTDEPLYQESIFRGLFRFLKEDRKDPTFKQEVIAKLGVLQASSLDHSTFDKFGDSDMLAIIFGSNITKAVGEQPVQTLCTMMPIVGCILSQQYQATQNVTTRMVMSGLHLYLKDELERRCADSQDVAQAVGFLLNSGFVDPETIDLNGVMVSQTSHSATAFYEEFFFDQTHDVGDTIEVPQEFQLYHPFLCDYGLATQIRVQKVFKTKTRPLLVQMTHSHGNPSAEFMYKEGDDLKQDVAILEVFKMMNQIWIKGNVRCGDHHVHTHIYKCVAMGPNWGCVEFVQNCLALTNINELGAVEASDRLIASAAGSYIAAFILGIRDRHSDNILINRDDFSLFHIDFGYILGKGVKGIDTGPFAITKELQQIFANGKKWDQFVEICVEAYRVLRRHYQVVIEYSVLVLSPVFDHKKVRSHLRETLKTDNSSEKDACSKIKQLITKAASNLQTRAKNYIHQIVVGRSE